MQFTTQVTRSQGGVSGLSLYAQGTPATLSSDEFGAGFISELNARYANLCKAGLVFGVQYASAALAAPSATATGSFALFNPNNSGKNLVLLDATVGLTVISTASTTGITAAIIPVANQQPTTVTPGNTPFCTFIGSSNSSIAKTYTVGTLVGAPTTAVRNLGIFYADLIANDLVGLKDEIAGAVVIAPGSGITVAGTTGTPADISITLGYTWAELPV